MSRTVVTLLLDRTGSMEPRRDATIEAFNGYVAGLRGNGADAAIDLTLIQFDAHPGEPVIQPTFVAVPIADVPALTHEAYVPRGATPLVDAFVETIRAVEAAVAALNEPDVKVVVAAQTDGAENASTRYTTAALRELIDRKTADGWQFVFLGAGLDVFGVGAALGLSVANTMTYDAADPRATHAAFAATAQNVRAFATGARADVGYSTDQRRAARDAFYPDAVPPSPAPATVVTPPLAVTATTGGATVSPVMSASTLDLIRRGPRPPALNLSRRGPRPPALDLSR